MPKREAEQRREHRPVFNPLDKKQLAVSVGEALLASELHPLPPHTRVAGAGVYAIYYLGDNPLYGSLVASRDDVGGMIPIYVGKAIPVGGRKGLDLFEASVGSALHSRLNEHADSIKQTADLEISDFKCRYLVVDDIWIPLGESLLIRRFRPVWNVTIDGFGNHDPGSGRYRQQVSPWDVLHPGRVWASRLASSVKTRGQLVAAIEKHFRP